MKYEKGTFIVVPNKDTLRGLDPQTQVLFLWICSYADEAGVCFPSITKLAEDCGISKRTVDSRLRKLCELGVLEVTNRAVNNLQTSNEYQILLRYAGDALRSAGDAGGYRRRCAPRSAGDAHELNPYITKSIELNTHGELGKVKLSTDEYNKLVSQLNQGAVDQLITELDLYIASTGKKYSSHYATIQAWARRRINDHHQKIMSKGKRIIGL